MRTNSDSDSNDYDNVLDDETESVDENEQQPPAQQVRVGKSSFPDSDEVPTAAELQNRAMATVLLRHQMTDDGMLETIQQERERVSSIVRTKIFKKVKFSNPLLMGKVALKVHKFMGAEEYSTKENFGELWEQWIRKLVRNTINEKRSAVNQAIHKSLVRRKWCW